MSETAINLLLQIPLAGVVVFVVWMFLQYLQRWQNQMMTFLGEQETKNQDFLREQRTASNDAIGRLAEEIKAVRGEIRELNGMMKVYRSE